MLDISNKYVNAMVSAYGQTSSHILSFWGLDIQSTLFSTELELQVCVQHSTKFANKPFHHIKYTDDPDSDDFDRAETRTAKAVCPFKAIKTIQRQEEKKKTEIVTMQMFIQLKYTLL